MTAATLTKDASLANSDHIKEVREHYDRYPYPHRDPSIEHKVTMTTYIERLNAINYYLFEGKRDFTDNFRVLVAGGGTGDGALLLAEQLQETNAEIVYLDFSKTAMDIAKARAKARGLTNIKWAHESLMELPRGDFGAFDYIQCSGVLHHLESPKKGLEALASVLKEDGGMNIMVYAEYGREGVYQIQKLMRQINPPQASMQAKVDNTRKVLASLPGQHVFKQMSNAGFFAHDLESDAGIYDLLLHGQDRPYTVPQIYEWVEGCGLHVGDFLSESQHMNTIYRPKAYIKDAKLLKQISALPAAKQYEIAELLNGKMLKHSFTVSKKPRKLPTVSDLEYRFVLTEPELADHTYAGFSQAFQQGLQINLTVHKVKFSYKAEKNKYLERIFAHMDRQTPLKEVYDKVQSGYRGKKIPSYETLASELQPIFTMLNDIHMVTLLK
jgi:ubiquinone/menaquinone biosynthesis C-methylase UbiE